MVLSMVKVYDERRVNTLTLTGRMDFTESDMKGMKEDFEKTGIRFMVCGSVVMLIGAEEDRVVAVFNKMKGGDE